MADPAFSVQLPGAAPGAPLVSSLQRWAATSAIAVAGLAAIYDGFLVLSHATPTPSTLTRLVGLGAPAIMVIVFALLRAEESRLARELRTVRTGTPVLRALIARRRQQLPFLTRWSSTKLGTAAVLLADGDRDGAIAALRSASVFTRVGRLETLRAFVEADLERKTGTSVGLERCVQKLLASELTGNREADLYRLHVLVKALLEQGDGETGDDLARALGASSDDEVRVYATWLRVWFDLDGQGEARAPGDPSEGDDPGPGEDSEAGAAGASDDAASVEMAEPAESWPSLSEGELRMAALAARSHGAERLVSKLAERLSAIAQPVSRG